jgi:hypothetical protein
MPTAPAALLEANDPDRAQAFKTKIRDRIGDVRRHLVALRAAMAEFGENFDLDAFTAAYDSEDPKELNRVKAVERGVDQDHRQRVHPVLRRLPQLDQPRLQAHPSAIGGPRRA